MQRIERVAQHRGRRARADAAYSICARCDTLQGLEPLLGDDATAVDLLRKNDIFSVRVLDPVPVRSNEQYSEIFPRHHDGILAHPALLDGSNGSFRIKFEHLFVNVALKTTSQPSAVKHAINFDFGATAILTTLAVTISISCAPL